jgi:acyl-CoA synthetase (AMP-forming)/AMP-acid ligase II
MQEGASKFSDLLLAALARPAGERAIQYRGEWYDWAWMRRTAERVNALLDEAGVGQEDAIAIAPGNRPACAAALLGLFGRLRDVVMIYAYQSPEAIGRKIRDLNCAAVLAQPEAWEEPARQAAVETGALAISLGETAQEIVSGTSVDRSVQHRRAEEPTGIHLLTSGTTGPPKLRHQTYDFVFRSMVVESAVHPYGDPPLTTPVMFASAFGNIAGLYSWLPNVVSGRPVIMVDKFRLAEFLAYVKEWRPVSANMPPAGYREMMDQDVPPEALAGVKYMGGGASAFDADLQDAVQKKYGVLILQSYGATEFGGVVAMVRPEHIEEFGVEKAFSVGRPRPGVKFRIVDPETGEILPPGTPGEFHVWVPRVGPEWLRTSDLAKVDEDGFLYYLGRTDGAIVRGGFKVDPEAVRAALLAHPAIYDAVVAGAPDRRLGEVPVAAYVVRSGEPGPTPEELDAHLRGRLPATFVPKAYRQVEALPFTPTNKPDLGAVRAMFEDGA